MSRSRMGIALFSLVSLFAFHICTASAIDSPTAGSSIVVAAATGSGAGTGEFTPSVSEVKPSAGAAAAPAPAEERLFGGPYVTDVTPNSAVLNWVLRGNRPASGQAVDVSPAAQGWRVLHSKVSSLRPFTTYYYDVLRNGSSEGMGQFTTPPNSSSNFTFAVYGDTRSRLDVQREIANKLAGQSPAFVVHTGDMVADGNNAQMWPQFFEASKELLRKVALFPALGNHEKNTPFFAQFFPHPTSYYSFDWGDVHVAVLNSDVGTVARSPAERDRFWREQLDWLERDLAAASSARFRFVALHHTPYTAIGNRQAAAQKLAAQVVPIFRKYRVQAVFSGHDHNYQRHVADGIQYLVTGGGGAPLYEANSPIPGITQKVNKIENFVMGRVVGHECRFQAIDREGRVIDSVVITADAAKKSAVGSRQ